MPVTLERRIASAVVDALFYTFGCAALLLRYFAKPMAWVERAAIVVMLLALVWEAVSGLTPGRVLTGLRVANEDGSPAARRTLLVRTGIKSLPLVLFLIGWGARSPVTDFFWWSAAILAQFYATWYYFAVARRDRSPFDLPVGTRVVRG